MEEDSLPQLRLVHMDSCLLNNIFSSPVPVRLLSLTLGESQHLCKIEIYFKHGKSNEKNLKILPALQQVSAVI